MVVSSRRRHPVGMLTKPAAPPLLRDASKGSRADKTSIDRETLLRAVRALVACRRLGRAMGGRRSRGSSKLWAGDPLSAPPPPPPPRSPPQAALQDHLARNLRVPGAPRHVASIEPGSELTLAQRLDLVPRPPPLLSEDQWREVHERCKQRQDSDQECAICR